MNIVTEEELAARLDYMSPIRPEPEKPESVWCIPFEYGGSAKGTRISIALAKTIAAELRASVAEAEKRELRRELRRALEGEKKRVEAYAGQIRAAQDKEFAALGEVAALKRKLLQLRTKKRAR